MALIPQGGQKPAIGYAGMWQNMEECNSFSAFASAVLPFGVPVMRTAGGADMNVAQLTGGNKLIGISLSNIYTTGQEVQEHERYGVGDLLGVADMGTVFVRAGAGVVKGNNVWFDTATLKFHGASAAGRLPLPGVEFDGTASDGDVVAVRIRLVPGEAAVTAVA